MKKFLSALTVLCLLLSTSLAVFGAEKPVFEEINSKLIDGASYVAGQTGTYKVKDAYNFERLIRYADIDEVYTDAFVNDVKDNLNANGGKIIVSEYDYYTDTYNDVESVTYYASVIRALDELGEDVTDFNGVDLTALFLAYNPDVVIDNPYYYSNVIYVAGVFGSDTLAKAYIDTMIDNYYVMGSGLNYWGFSCDNTAHFIEALYFYGDDYIDYLRDAVNVIKSYKLDKGYFSDSVFTPDANANSTAMALQAYCIALPYLENELTEDDLNDTYTMLKNFETAENGVYDYTDNVTPNAFATADAVVGLGEFLPYILLNEIHNEDAIDNATQDTTTQKPVATDNNDKEIVIKSPYTGVTTSAVAFTLALIGAGTVTVIKKKNNL